LEIFGGLRSYVSDRKIKLLICLRNLV